MADTYSIRIGGGIAPEMFASLDKLVGSVNGLNGVLGNLGKSLLGVFGGIQIAQIITGNIQLADEMGKLSQKIGVTVEDMSRLSFAAERSDLSLSTLKTGVKELSEWMVKNGQSSRSVLDVLVETSNIFHQMPDGAAKSALAIERFGRAGLDMIPFLNEGPVGLKALFLEAERLGLVTEHSSKVAGQFNDELTNLSRASGSLAREFSTIFLPSLTSIVRGFTDLLVETRKIISEYPAVVSGLEAIRNSIIGVGVALAGLKIFGSFAAIFGGISTLKELIVAVGLAIQSTMARIVSWIGVTTTVLQTGIEAWRSWVAGKGEALSLENLAAQNETLIGSLEKSIALREKEGSLTKEQTANLREQLAFLKEQKSLLGPSISHQVLMGLSRQTRGASTVAKNEKEFTAEEVRKARRLADAKAQAELQVESEKIKTDEWQLENSYGRRLISLEKYLEQRQSIIERRSTLETAFAARGLTNPDTEARQRASAEIAMIQARQERELLQLHDIGRLERERIAKEKKEAAEEKAERDRAKMEAVIQAAEDARRRQQIADANALAEVQGSQNIIANDPDLSRIQKKERLLELLTKELSLLSQQAATNSMIAATSEDPDTRLQAEGEMNRLLERRVQILHTISDLQREDSFVESLQFRWNQFLDSARTGAQMMADLVMSPFHGLQQGIASATEQMLMGTATLAEGIRSIWNSVVSSIIKSFAEMVAEWITKHAIMKTVSLAWSAFKTALGIKDVAESNTREAQKTPLLAQNATLASVASWGLAVAIGVGAIAAILAGIGAFKDGGFTGEGNPNAPAGIIHKREFVIPANRVDEFGVGFFEGIRNGSIQPGETGGQSMPVAPSGSKGVNLTLILVDQRDERAALDALESAAGEVRIIKVVKKNKIEIGIPS